MTYLERQDKILKMLSEKDSCPVKYLSEVLNVSYNTVHSDINNLIKLGHPITKIHGNILLEGSAADINKRSFNQHAEKEIISELFINTLPKNQQLSFFFDSSTTNINIVKRLVKLNANMICATNYVDLAYITGNYPNIMTIMFGGSWWNTEHSIIGDAAVQDIAKHHVDIAVLGCSGLSMKRGIFNPYAETILIKHEMAKNADQVWLVCDHTKWGKDGFLHLFDFSDIDIILTSWH